MLNYQRYQVSNSPGSSSIQSLQTMATNTMISQLGQVAEGINSRFTCGGKYEMPSNKPIKLVYCQAADTASSEEWSSVKFPGVSEADMMKLLEACSVASYGYTEGKDVADKNYQNAFRMEPDNFFTSFQMCAIPILQEIQSIVPTVMGLKAELYKLNIYARGGFFKAHVDTPRSDKMFGSLVVCLPTQFTGGELIVRHHKQEMKYDWSSSGSDTSSALHWAAFFSDVEHEVLPVSEGYRVTLTYNLSYYSKEGGSTFDVKSCSFYKLLQAALSNPVFMRDGGVLGFNSHYSYMFDTQWADLLTPINTIEDKADTIKQLGEIVQFIHLSEYEQLKVLRCVGVEGINCKQIILDALPSDLPLLKGADYIVVESAKSLGLPVCVSKVYDHRGDALMDFSHVLCTEDFEDDDVEALNLKHKLNYWQMYTPQDITWCQDLSFRYPTTTYGYKANFNLDDKFAAIFIRIPKWSEYRQKLIAVSTGEYGYDNIVQREIQRMLHQVEEFLNNKYIRETWEFRSRLKGIHRQMIMYRSVVSSVVSSGARVWHLQASKLVRIKCEFQLLRYYIKHNNYSCVRDQMYQVMKELWS